MIIWALKAIHPTQLTAAGYGYPRHSVERVNLKYCCLFSILSKRGNLWHSSSNLLLEYNIFSYVVRVFLATLSSFRMLWSDTWHIVCASGGRISLYTGWEKSGRPEKKISYLYHMSLFGFKYKKKRVRIFMADREYNGSYPQFLYAHSIQTHFSLGLL